MNTTTYLVPLRTCLINTAKSNPINAITRSITLLASTSTICDADLNSHEITLPTTPGIGVAALPARDLR